jgi:hypothetical protein
MLANPLARLAQLVRSCRMLDNLHAGNIPSQDFIALLVKPQALLAQLELTTRYIFEPLRPLVLLVQLERTARQLEADFALSAQLELSAHQASQRVRLAQLDHTVYLVDLHVPLLVQLDLLAILDHLLAWLVQQELTNRRAEIQRASLAQLELTVEAAHQPLAHPAQPDLTAHQADPPACLAQLEHTAHWPEAHHASLAQLALTTRRPEGAPFASLAQRDLTAVLANQLARLAQLERTTRRPGAPPRPHASPA